MTQRKGSSPVCSIKNQPAIFRAKPLESLENSGFLIAQNANTFCTCKGDFDL